MLFKFTEVFFSPFLCSGVRPFGVSLLVAGFDDSGPQLYQVFPFSNVLLNIVMDHFSICCFQLQEMMPFKERTLI